MIGDNWYSDKLEMDRIRSKIQPPDNRGDSGWVVILLSAAMSLFVAYLAGMEINNSKARIDALEKRVQQLEQHQ